MRVVRKVIFRRFRISNQIFNSIYRSRDIARSLDTTFGPNLTFRDEYLENDFFFDKRFSQAERYYSGLHSLQKWEKSLVAFPR